MSEFATVHTPTGSLLDDEDVATMDTNEYRLIPIKYMIANSETLLAVGELGNTYAEGIYGFITKEEARNCIASLGLPDTWVVESYLAENKS